MALPDRRSEGYCEIDLREMVPIADRMGGQSLDFNNDELHRTNLINLQLLTVAEYDLSHPLIVTAASTSTYNEQMLDDTHTYMHRRTHMYRQTYTHEERIVTQLVI